MLYRPLALAALFAIILPAIGQAEPMWNTADIWVCETASHFKISLNGEDLRVKEESNRKVMDFTAGTVSTGFGNPQGAITGTRYYDGLYGGFNLIEIEYNGQPYPQIIAENHGEYWSTIVSGHAGADRELWIANYQCRPQG